MFRLALPGCCLLVILIAATMTWADSPALKEAQALQEAMQNAIQEAEPAIACILVSRSEDYIKHEETPVADGSGRLGRFHLLRAQQRALNMSPPGTDPDTLKDRIKKLDLSIPGNVPESYGSGVVIDESGLILTNEHVIRDATKIFVRLPGEKGYYADIHAADPRSDLAVLRLLVDSPKRFKTIKLGDGGKARKGQWVVSLANPFAAGFRDGSPSASWGIISNVRRRPAGSANELERAKPVYLYQHGILLQTDCRLNAGSSGGALIDLRGELIGLTTAIAAITGSETAGGFALPIDAGMKRIIDVLKRGEEVEYGFLGVSLSPDPRPLEAGILISAAVPASPAALKGLGQGDIILSVNGTAINDYDELFLAISTTLAGSEARLEISRGGGPARTLTVTLDKFPVLGRIIASKKPPALRGLRVDYLSVLGPQPKDIANGVVVREVVTGTSAAQALLKVNDVITHVRGQAVNTPADFYRKMQTLTGPVELTLANSYKVTLN
jgi:serine protease Do